MGRRNACVNFLGVPGFAFPCVHPLLQPLEFMLADRKNNNNAVVAARPLMLSPCLTTSPTSAFSDVTSAYHQQRKQPVTLHSPMSLSGVAVVGDGQPGLVSPVNSSSGSSSSRPWPTSPTDHQPLDSWVQGSAESLVGQVLSTLFFSLGGRGGVEKGV